MPKGGRIVIELRNETRTQVAGPGAAGLDPGDYVALVVLDNGAGMSPDVLSRAFEPFFTTKSTGRGSGLGLSMVYGFARQSGGGITIASEPGRGTTATLLLPRAPAPTESAADVEPEPPPAISARGSETVLVVEDEAPVRRFVRRELERLGYRVLQASDGPSALRLIRTEIPIDLLFVDIIMPGGLNGVQVAAAARALRPTLRVLLTSGYSDTVLEQQGADEPFGRPLQKPYQLSDLAGAIRGKLDPVAL
jgi:CheY-like chemotaxis protein